MTSYVALFGDPVEGNPTSRMQNAAFRALGLDWLYLDIRVSARDLPAAVAGARAMGFAGLNLTLPHKVSVVPLLDRLDRSAALTGAVNTVRRDPAGRLVGSNTDGLGFLGAVRDAGIEVTETSVVLLGAGGAARAVAMELALAGAREITIVNRSVTRRERLRDLIRSKTSARAQAIPWRGTVTPPPCEILVNCTPVGMGTGEAAEQVPAVALEALVPGTVVCDLNPDRPDTAFLRRARQHGLRTLSGLPMLARQGAAGFELWTGGLAPLELMIAALERPAAALVIDERSPAAELRDRVALQLHDTTPEAAGAASPRQPERARADVERTQES